MNLLSGNIKIEKSNTSSGQKLLAASNRLNAEHKVSKDVIQPLVYGAKE